MNSNDLLLHLKNTLLTQLKNASLPYRFETELSYEQADLLWQFQHPDHCGTWVSREADFKLKAFGQSDIVDALEDVQSKTKLFSNTFYFGGTAFPTAKFEDSCWKTWPSTFFFLPYIELIYFNKSWKFRVNVLNSLQAESFWIEAFFLRFNAVHLTIEPVLQKRIDQPAKDEWIRAVDEVKTVLKETPLKKVVLARKTSWKTPFDVETWLHESFKEGQTYQFFLKIYQKTFFGLSPERLVKLEENAFKTEALAGTRPRGKTNDSDKELFEDLLQSEKDKAEHEWVRHYFESLFEKNEISFKTLPLHIKQWTHVQHLLQTLEGVLPPNYLAERFVNDIFPTPAVCGYPKQEALDFLDHNEGLDRGWYSGYVGVVGKNYLDLAVAIRCGLYDGETLSVFVGAGITQDSSGLKEWEELEAKMALFSKVHV